MNNTNNFIAHLNLHGGVIIYNDFDIDESIPFDDQKYSYKQDILQVEFGNRLILDVGWPREFNPNGYFIVQGVKDENWDPPMKKIKAKTLSELKKAIEQVALFLAMQKEIIDDIVQ